MNRNPYRIGIAVVATILTLPCFGFCAIGALHAQESPDQAFFWTGLYIGLDLVLIGLVVWLWNWALRRTTPPTGCPNCGYDLSGRRRDRCPECGIARRP